MTDVKKGFLDEWKYGFGQPEENIVSGPEPQKPAFLEEMFTQPYDFKSKGETGPYGLYQANLGHKTFVDRSSDDFSYWRTRRHEAEHDLQFKNPLSSYSYAEKWRRNTGDDYSEFLGKFNNRTKQIKKSYPELERFSNFDKVNLTPTGFKEALASLAEHEWAMQQKDPRYDITTDPAFDGLWDNKSMQSFRAMTGLRNTITDPKDIPPATVDTKQNWYRR